MKKIISDSSQCAGFYFLQRENGSSFKNMPILILFSLIVLFSCNQANTDGSKSHTSTLTQANTPVHYATEKELTILDQTIRYDNIGQQAVQPKEALEWIEEYFQPISTKPELTPECEGLGIEELITLFHLQDKVAWFRQQGFQWVGTNKYFMNEFSFGRCRLSGSGLDSHSRESGVTYRLSGNIWPDTPIAINHSVKGKGDFVDIEFLENFLKKHADKHIYTYDFDTSISSLRHEHVPGSNTTIEHAYHYKGLKWFFGKGVTKRQVNGILVPNDDDILISQWNEEEEAEIKKQCYKTKIISYE